MYENFVVAKITVSQGQINLFICSFFVEFSASLELDIHKGYITANQNSELVQDVCTSINFLTKNPKHSERQWIAKKIFAEYRCVAGMILVDLETEWNGEV